MSALGLSDLLHFAEHTLQEVALCFMALVYIVRIIWLLSFKNARDRFKPTGRTETNPVKGELYSLANIAMPWAMESTRTKLFFYFHFAVFHIGVACAIGLSFIIPYAPKLLHYELVVRAIQVLAAAAFIIGVGRMLRRIVSPVMRLISTPDDYFSLGLLTVWFVFVFFSAPNTPEKAEGALLVFFFLTALFLVYVPFSKISHYLYYPFNRFWLGRTLGHRGVYPLQPSVKVGGSK